MRLLLATLTSAVAASSPGISADLRIEYRPLGPGGAVRRSALRCDAAHRPPLCPTLGRVLRSIRPLPATAVCSELYGGPATARISGTLNGEPVDLRFDLANGCEIARMHAAAPLLPG